MDQPRRIQEALDLNRYAEICKAADLGGNLWDALGLAAERGDQPAAEQACRQIAVLTKHAFALVKLLGNPDPDDG